MDNVNGASTITPRSWLWTAGVLSAIAVFEATQTVFGMWSQGMHHNWSALYLTVVLSWLPWVLVTPLVLRLGSQIKIKPASYVMHASIVLGMNVASSAWAALTIVSLNPLALSPPPGPFMHTWLGQFEGSLLSTLMIYAGIIAVGHILDARTRIARQEAETARLNEQLSKAQFEALRRQIEPHFLFNTLNSIAGLVRDNQNDLAVTMIARLSELLRRVIEDPKRPLVTLAEEMEFSCNYIEIQKIRFADRLTLNVDVPGDLLSAQVPSLLLQPMLENAVKHGISHRAQGGAIRISAARTNGMLILRVYNDGPSLAAARKPTGESALPISAPVCAAFTAMPSI
jgi:sensor histidine kinase YesM